MNNLELTDRFFLPELEAYFTKLCTILEDPTPEQHDSGQPDPDFVPLAGHEDIPCFFAKQGSAELRLSDFNQIAEEYDVILYGYYPEIAMKHRASVDGVERGIIGVFHDSRETYTRIRLDKVDL